MDITEFLSDQSLLQLLADHTVAFWAIREAAGMIAKWTPTKTDDNLIAMIDKYILRRSKPIKPPD